MRQVATKYMNANAIWPHNRHSQVVFRSDRRGWGTLYLGLG